MLPCGVFLQSQWGAWLWADVACYRLLCPKHQSPEGADAVSQDTEECYCPRLHEQTQEDTKVWSTCKYKPACKSHKRRPVSWILICMDTKYVLWLSRYQVCVLLLFEGECCVLQEWYEEVPSPSSWGGGHPAQDDTDPAQSLLPRWHRRGGDMLLCLGDICSNLPVEI